MVTKVESFEVLLKSAENEFRSRFKYEPNIVTAAPGRVNLIGEHIDYNHGFVLPMVILCGTYFKGLFNNYQHLPGSSNGYDYCWSGKQIRGNSESGHPDEQH